MARSIDEFLKLAQEFSSNGYEIFLVGGTVRDFIIYKEFDDYDLATPATPEEIAKFIPDCDLTFAKFGAVKVKRNKTSFVITTFRKESKYKDSRHPSNIKFVKSMKVDVKRRDFTINGIYMDARFAFYDYVNGRDDIDNKIIRTIGKPSKRIKEDPLRIIRAVRFATKLDFTLEKKLAKYISKHGDLLTNLNRDKVREELGKFDINLREKRDELFKQLNIFNYIEDMLK